MNNTIYLSFDNQENYQKFDIVQKMSDGWWFLKSVVDNSNLWFKPSRSCPYIGTSVKPNSAQLNYGTYYKLG